MVALLKNPDGSLSYDGTSIRKDSAACREECCDDCPQESPPVSWTPSATDCCDCPLTAVSFATDVEFAIDIADSGGGPCSGTISNVTCDLLTDCPGACGYTGTADFDVTVDLGVVATPAFATNIGFQLSTDLTQYVWVIAVWIEVCCDPCDLSSSIGGFMAVFERRYCDDDGDCVALGTYEFIGVFLESNCTVTPTAGTGTLS